MMNINTVMTGNLTPFDFDVEEEIQKLLEDKDCNISITHGSDSPQLAAFYKNAERSEVQANTPQLAAGKFISNKAILCVF